MKTGNYKKGPDNFDDWCKRHEITDKEAIELLKSMLSLDPAKRIKSEDAALVGDSRAHAGSSCFVCVLWLGPSVLVGFAMQSSVQSGCFQLCCL